MALYEIENSGSSITRQLPQRQMIELRYTITICVVSKYRVVSSDV
jgi:hypothetical protein